MLSRLRVRLLSPSRTSRVLRLACLTILASSLIFGITPRVYAHAHGGDVTSGHDHPWLNASGTVYGSPLGDSTPVALVGESGEIDLPTAVDEPSWHVHAVSLLSGAAHGPTDWSLSLGAPATGAGFPGLPPVARQAGNIETPLRPPRRHA
jgi:hypothetical protein